MNAAPSSTYADRSIILGSQLRQFRHDADRVGRADTVHALRNAVLTVEGALRLAQAHLHAGGSVDVDTLLNLAETRLREGRALIALSRRPFFRAA